MVTQHLLFVIFLLYIYITHNNSVTFQCRQLSHDMYDIYKFVLRTREESPDIINNIIFKRSRNVKIQE